MSSGPHALLLAVHSWTHQPLRRVLDLVDVLLVSRDADPQETSALAARWHLARLWHTVQAAALALLADGPTPLPCLIWARNLSEVRERTVLETHLERWLSPLGAWPTRQALAASGAALRNDLQPAPGQSWAAQLEASEHGYQALVHARVGPRAPRTRGRPPPLADELPREFCDPIEVTTRVEAVAVAHPHQLGEGV